MLSLAVATLWQKRTSTSQLMSLLPNLWLQCFVSSFAFAAIEGSQGSLAPTFTSGFAVSVLWTGLSTLGGYGLYWLCLRRSSETRVTSVLYLSPPITLLWAWAMFDEPLSLQMWAGMAISAIGIWLVMRVEAQQAALQSTAPVSTAITTHSTERQDLVRSVHLND
jgi:drug/metabolite transporter (DMT)-like permease